MSDQNTAHETEIAHSREIPPHIICPPFREEVNGNSLIYTDDPVIGIRGRIFYFDVPLAPVALTPRSREILNRLKSRSSTHINLLCAEYIAFRYERFAGKNRDVGIMLQVPRPRVERALAMVRAEDGEVRAAKLQNEHLKALVLRLREKGEEYLEAVEASWLHHDHGNFEHKVQYYKDVGLLMQIPKDQAREILHILLEMVLDGKIFKSKDWDNDEFEFPWRILYDVDASVESPVEPPVEASGPHVQNMPAPPKPDDDKKRKAPDDDDDQETRQPSSKKAKRGGYIPLAGEWKCGKCGWWSNLEFCTRKDRNGQSVCSGRRG